MVVGCGGGWLRWWLVAVVVGRGGGWSRWWLVAVVVGRGGGGQNLKHMSGLWVRD